MQLNKFQKQNFDIYLNIIFGVLYFFGAVFFCLDFSFNSIRELSELFLFFCALGFFFATYYSYRYQAKFNFKHFLVWTIITFFSTLIIEIVGTATGVIFGSYEYGQTLRLQIFNTPVVIGFNWVILIVSGTEITRRFTSRLAFFKETKTLIKLFFNAIIAALLITFFDFIMEPSAVYLDYWSWGSENIYQIPVQNYVAWFLISLIFSFYYLSLKIKIKSSFVSNIFWFQLMFFGLLRLFRL